MIQKISGINLGNTCKQASGNLKTQKQQRQLLFRQLAPQYPVSDFYLGFHRIDRNAQLLRHLAVFHIFQHHQLQNHPALFRQIIHRFPHRRHVPFLCLLILHIPRRLQIHQAGFPFHLPQTGIPHRHTQIIVQRHRSIQLQPLFPNPREHVLHHLLRLLV